MPDDPITLLRRASDRIPIPPDAFGDLARRRVRVRRNRRIASFGVAGVAFGAAVLMLVLALPHTSSRSGPAGRPVPSPVGTAPAGIGSIETIRALSPERVVALADHALIVTTDRGDHWTDISPPGFDDFVAARMFFLDADHAWVACIPRGALTSIAVFRTVDGGTTWTRSDLPVPSPLDQVTTGPGFTAPDLGFLDPTDGWMVLSNSMPEPSFVTSDGGASWQRGPDLEGGPGAHQFKNVTFTTPSDGWAVGERNVPLSPTTDKEIDSLLRTGDGGSTWQSVHLPTPPIPGATPESISDLGIPRFFGGRDAVAPAWAYQDGDSAMFLYVTHDGGETWEATNPIPIHQGEGSPIFIPSFPSASDWIVGSTSREIATTTDGGTTWSVRQVDEMGPYGPASLEFSSVADGWAMTCEAWSGSMNGDTQCNGPAIPGRAGRYALYRTVDGGATWTLVLANGPPEG